MSVVEAFSPMAKRRMKMRRGRIQSMQLIYLQAKAQYLTQWMNGWEGSIDDDRRLSFMELIQ